eukprot:GILJ01014330.1.p1 GENE.GILJ01014330.1~~GILJ01014330.1.p1  ORF type:complete len:232 (-),score=43.25 GILJ01014330.1:109-804(-)
MAAAASASSVAASSSCAAVAPALVDGHISSADSGGGSPVNGMASSMYEYHSPHPYLSEETVILLNNLPIQIANHAQLLVWCDQYLPACHLLLQQGYPEVALKIASRWLANSKRNLKLSVDALSVVFRCLLIHALKRKDVTAVQRIYDLYVKKLNLTPLQFLLLVEDVAGTSESPVQDHFKSSSDQSAASSGDPCVVLSDGRRLDRSILAIGLDAIRVNVDSLTMLPVTAKK